MTTMNQPPTAAAPSPHLLVMPLHAITEVHGEAGRRWNSTVYRLPSTDRAFVQEAFEWASVWHAGQRRTREPYVNTCYG